MATWVDDELAAAGTDAADVTIRLSPLTESSAA